MLGPSSQIQPANCFCMAPKLRMVLMFLNGWKKVRRRLFDDTWNLYDIQISLSINIYWNTATLIRLHNAERLCCGWRSWVAVTETIWALRLKIFPLWPFTENLPARHLEPDSFSSNLHSSSDTRGWSLPFFKENRKPWLSPIRQCLSFLHKDDC